MSGDKFNDKVIRLSLPTVIVIISLLVFASGIFYQIFSTPKKSEMAVENRENIIRIMSTLENIQTQQGKIENKVDRLLNRERRDK